MNRNRHGSMMPRDKSSLGRSYVSNGYATSIRSGIRPQSEGRCFKLFRCFVACYNSRLITVEPVIFLYMFSLYLYEVIFQLYVFNTYGQRELNNIHGTNDTRNHCLTTEDFQNMSHSSIFDPDHDLEFDDPGDHVQSKTAWLSLMVGAIARFPSILTALVLGPVSDRYGRKPALIFVLCGMLVSAILTYVIIHMNLNLHYFILSSGSRGITGGIAGILTVCYSYVADVSSTKWLTVRLGFLEAMTFIAGSLSLVTGGVWTQLTNCSFSGPPWAILGCIVCAISFTLIAVPESLDHDGDHSKKSVEPKFGPKALLRGVQIFFNKSYPRWKLWICLFVLTVTVINMTGTTAVITLFLLHEPLQWQPLKIGVFLASSELIHGIGLVIILPILIAVGVSDGLIALIAIFLACAMEVCLAFVVKTWQTFLVGVVLGVEALITPALKAIMSKAVSPQDQGALFSFISAVQVFSSVLAYIIYSSVYSQALKLKINDNTPIHASGISFLVMAVLYLITIPFLLVLLLVKRREQTRRSRRGGRTYYAAINSNTPASSYFEQSVGPGVNSSPSPIPEEYQKPKSELAEDALERSSLVGSDAHSDLSRSYHSIGSFRPHRY